MRKYNYRGNYDEDSKQATNDYEVLLKNITIYDLIKAFKKALLDRPEEPVHQIKNGMFRLMSRWNFISSKIKGNNNVSFLELMIEMREKIRIVVTFIAMLEMVKAGTIGLRESINLNDFVIYGIANG